MTSRTLQKTSPFIAMWLAVFVCVSTQAQNTNTYCPNYDGQMPPKLIVSENGWMNYGGELSLEKLRGHVVWLEFSFIACGGCQMMKPHLQGLQHRYGPDGLVVIEVNNGKVDTREALAKELDHLQPNYPVLWDKDGKTCDAYGVTKYGTAYLIGTDGKVLWGGNPLDLSIYDLWNKLYGALRDVDLDALQQAGDTYLVHNLVDEQHSNHTAARTKPPQDQQDTYTIGWDFSICTTDNSMLIEGVRAGSPVALAGLKSGDTIVAIDDLVLSDVPFARLKEKIHQLEKSPNAITLGVRRDEEIRKITFTPEPTRRK